MLVGYGLVVGLNRTGDSQQTFFTVQTLANAMQKMGVLIAPAQVEVKNVAAVFITASLPPFARPGASSMSPFLPSAMPRAWKAACC